MKRLNDVWNKKNVRENRIWNQGKITTVNENTLYIKHKKLIENIKKV